MVPVQQASQSGIDYQLTALPPLSLYIHIPWCVRKCPYCDFNSHQPKGELPEQAYVDALLADLAESMPSVWGRQLTSIFIGGGTPSLFSGTAIERLLSGIRALLPFTADTEVTMEANPGTVDAERFEAYRKAGVNRLSLGVQSFDDQFLHELGRIHSALEARRAFSIARAAGFDNINLDLMYALPRQRLQQALDDLRIALDLQPEHLSWYQLTLEPNTAFYHHPPPLPDDDATAAISEAGIALLAEQGFQQYEVSAFAREGKQPSVHNLNYWQFGDYLGIGAGAHQKISRADEQTITRSSKWRNPKDYLDPAKAFTHQSKQLSARELPLEFMLNALRLKQGVPAEWFRMRTGLLNLHIKPALQKAVADGLLVDSQQQIQATEYGFQFLNNLLNYFVPEQFPDLASEKRSGNNPLGTTPQINIKQVN